MDRRGVLLFYRGDNLCIPPPGMEHSKRSQDGFVDYYFHTEEFLTADNRQVPCGPPLFCCRMTAKRALRGWCGSFKSALPEKAGRAPCGPLPIPGGDAALAAWMAGGSAVPW